MPIIIRSGFLKTRQMSSFADIAITEEDLTDGYSLGDIFEANARNKQVFRF